MRALLRVCLILGFSLCLVVLARAVIRLDDTSVTQNVDTGSSVTVTGDLGYMSGRVLRMWIICPALTGTATTYTMRLLTASQDGSLDLIPTLSGSEATTRAQDMSTTGIVLSGRPLVRFDLGAGQATSPTYRLIMMRDDYR